MGSLQGRCVVVVGRGGGIARAIALVARSEGARALGDDGKCDYFAHVSATNPAGRIGTVEVWPRRYCSPSPTHF